MPFAVDSGLSAGAVVQLLIGANTVKEAQTARHMFTSSADTIRRILLDTNFSPTSNRDQIVFRMASLRKEHRGTPHPNIEVCHGVKNAVEKLTRLHKSAFYVWDTQKF